MSYAPGLLTLYTDGRAVWTRFQVMIYTKIQTIKNMQQYNFIKTVDGKQLYLQPDHTFSDNQETAKVIKVNWLAKILDILKILLPILIQLFGDGKLKLKK